MANTKTQEKFLKLLELLNGCREKLYATYNLYITHLEQVKTTKLELGEKHNSMLDLYHEFKQLISASKPAKTRVSKLRKESEIIKLDCDEQVANVGIGIKECEICRKTYKHDTKRCCEVFNTLKAGGVEPAIAKGYASQVKLIKNILEKIDIAKIKYEEVKSQIVELKQMIDNVFDKINNQALSVA